MSESKDVNAIYEHVVSHIDDAISNGWIKAYYQPVIRGLTGQLCSAESLARWIDPEYGLLAPDKFIRALEKRKYNFASSGRIQLYRGVYLLSCSIRQIS